MIQVINLLQSKNHYLEKFYSLNEDALQRFRASDFEELDEFYSRREKLLEIIRYVDLRIDQEQALVSGAVTEESKLELKKSLHIKDEFVRRILEQDLEVLSLLDQEKSRIIVEMRQVEKGKGISKYKVPQRSRRLIEEA